MGVSYFKAKLGTGNYDTWTGAPVVGDDAIKVNDFDYKVDRGVMTEETTDSYVYSSAYGGALKIGGSIDSVWRPVSMTPLLTSLMGTPTLGVYTLGEPVHSIFEVGEAVGASTKARQFAGVGVKSCEFTFEAKEFVKCKWDWLARDVKDGTYDTALTYPVEDPLVFWRASLTIDDGGGAATLYSKNCSLTIDRALDEEQFVLGDYKRYRLVRTGVTDVSGTLGITEEQLDELDRAIYGSESGTAMPADNAIGTGTLAITCLKVGGTAGAAFSLPVKYTVTDFKHSGVGELEKSIDFIIVGTGMSITVTT